MKWLRRARVTNWRAPCGRRMALRCRRDSVRWLERCASGTPCVSCPSAVRTCPPPRTSRPSCPTETDRKSPSAAAACSRISETALTTTAEGPHAAWMSSPFLFLLLPGFPFLSCRCIHRFHSHSTSIPSLIKSRSFPCGSVKSLSASEVMRRAQQVTIVGPCQIH